MCCHFALGTLFQRKKPPPHQYQSIVSSVGCHSLSLSFGVGIRRKTLTRLHRLRKVYHLLAVKCNDLYSFLFVTVANWQVRKQMQFTSSSFDEVCFFCLNTKLVAQITNWNQSLFIRRRQQMGSSLSSSLSSHCKSAISTSP